MRSAEWGKRAVSCDNRLENVCLENGQFVKAGQGESRLIAVKRCVERLEWWVCDKRLENGKALFLVPGSWFFVLGWQALHGDCG